VESLALDIATATTAVMNPLVAAATTTVFFVAAVSKVTNYAALRDWSAHQLSKEMAAPVAVAMIVLDTCVALTLLAAWSGPLGHLIAAGILAAFLLGRFKLARAFRTCPCFGPAALRSGRAIDSILGILLGAHLLAYIAFPDITAQYDAAWTLAASVTGSVAITWILVVGAHAPSVYSGVLAPGQLAAFLSDIGAITTQLPMRTFVVSSHSKCSSCTLIASAWITVSRSLPAQWLSLFDMRTGLSTGSAMVEGVPLASLPSVVREALQIRATPALTIIEDSGRYMTFQGPESCQKAITELMAELRAHRIV
jgi:hypothetical protein